MVVLSLAPVPHARAAESAAQTSERDIATLVTDTDHYRPGAPLHVGLRLRLKPGWHTYWINPGDAGEAPTLAVQAGGGATGTSGAIAWPAPERLRDGPLMSYGYTGDVLLPATLQPTGAGDGPMVLKATAEWLVCASVCVPEQGQFTLTLPAGDPSPSAEAPQFARAAQARPLDSPFAATIAPDGTLSLTGAGLGRTAVQDAWFMPLTTGAIDQDADQPLKVADGTLTLALKPGDAFHAAPTLDGVLMLKDPAGEVRALAISARPGPAMAAPAAPPAAPAATVPLPAPQGAAGGLRMLLLAFAGGLILNLMPCVFPVLMMKAMALTRLAGAHTMARLAGAGAYAAGVVGAFMVLGGIMLTLRAAGAVAGWGFQFQSAAFVAAVCWLLFAVALNLLGVFGMGNGIAALGGAGVTRGGYLGDAMTGVLAVLVATPCTAPFMGAAIAGALTAPAWVAMAVFVAMGAGLAAPYLVLAGVPALARYLPRPGAWMDILRQGLAFPILATCVWLMWVLALQAGATAIAVLGTGLVLVGLAAWLTGLAQGMAMQDGPARQIRLCRALALTALAVAMAMLPGLRAAPAGADTGLVASGPAGTEPFSPTRLAALQAQGRPVFVDMTAAWCISCLVNERVALSSAPVQAAFRAQHVVYMKGDWTNRDATISAFLESHGRAGVPFYVYYPPGDAKGRILPQILTSGLVLDALKG
ncbi:protein-disulfide reductase DsbD family protein [Gluconacetobacter takamatsuzukensis]|uniref:Cytochrome C biogenesis protein n=1 Tax=Gluconacetobacter takamatsuzukensis TaxID=1286190 RepID=A0A7W4KBJ0_9PROT|nr:thioredoxin family protein [Gluconacetobacter takamatsuzukensis]MBB2203897.1 cytochrome C biogenesis protein [Gluconacetobacter takamatsuzukensis]